MGLTADSPIAPIHSVVHEIDIRPSRAIARTTSSAAAGVSATNIGAGPSRTTTPDSCRFKEMLERLRTDLNAAVKGRDATKVSVLRMLLADLHNRKIAARAELSEEQVVAALRTAVKQRQEAAEQFAAGGREDRAAAERAEISVIEAYLPSLLEGEELKAAVDSVIDKTGATSPADMGKVMGALMSEYQGRIDGKAANALVRERLGAS
jgi:hypothetical protein